MIALFLALAVTQIWACHPECSWSCDNPICAADCWPVCKPPVCANQCVDYHDLIHCAEPVCETRCPADQCESDECPACETVCDPLRCTDKAKGHCAPICEETECTWACQKPKDCPKPTCEQTCEEPACAAVQPVSVNPHRHHSSSPPYAPLHAALAILLPLSLLLVLHQH